jgi:predicted DNA-binding transcriptional regulator AlpA
VITMEKLIDVQKLMDLLSYKRSTLYTAMRNGRIGPMPIRISKNLRFREYEVSEWIRLGCPPRQVWIPMWKKQQAQNGGQCA